MTLEETAATPLSDRQNVVGDVEQTTTSRANRELPLPWPQQQNENGLTEVEMNWSCL